MKIDPPSQGKNQIGLSISQLYMPHASSRPQRSQPKRIRIWKHLCWSLLRMCVLPSAWIQKITASTFDKALRPRNLIIPESWVRPKVRLFQWFKIRQHLCLAIWLAGAMFYLGGRVRRSSVSFGPGRMAITFCTARARILLFPQILGDLYWRPAAT